MKDFGNLNILVAKTMWTSFFVMHLIAISQRHPRNQKSTTILLKLFEATMKSGKLITVRYQKRLKLKT